MPILGIYPSHNSGAAIISDDGEILTAINEGRLIKEKLYWGFPRESINTVLELADLSPDEIDSIVFGGHNPAIGKREAFDEIPPKKRLMELVSYLPLTGTQAFSKAGRNLFTFFRDDKKFREQLNELGLTAPISYYDHHYCHAASAYYTSPFDENTLIITVDAQGDFKSTGVYTVNDQGLIQEESWTPFYHSLGKYWAYVTHNLGFTPMRHEGKVSGLAAQGDPTVCIDVFRRYIQVDTGSLQLKSKIGCWNNPAAGRLHKDLQGIRREDIAAALQQRTEEVMVELTASAAERFGCSNLALAGGVFANVGLNQRLLELDSIEDIFIHPNMGDGGLAVGAAYAHWAEQKSAVGDLPEPRFMQTVYYGTSSSDEEIRSALEARDVEYRTPAEPHVEAGKLVAEGYVVGRYNGRLEYGPRALGNRSILALPTDPTCQDWLNERLDRTEFMPFAPSVLAEHIEDYFVDTTAGVDAGRFMTITFDVTEHGQTVAPGAVHIDGTARPQIVFETDNPTYYRVLESCNDECGYPIVLNTSFNTHGEPIVNDPDTAIRAYENGIVDALAIGEYILCEESRSPSIETTGKQPVDADN
jgi:carbamoyltransferase